MTRYYKLGLSGDSLDSVAKMAENLFAGGSVDGDTALCEAALSVRCFMNLCELGVAFPVNRYGEYVGYKTDHDPFERATSAGPLTSKFMTQALQTHAEQLGVEVLDGYFALEILTRQNAVCGLFVSGKADRSADGDPLRRYRDVYRGSGGNLRGQRIPGMPYRHDESSASGRSESTKSDGVAVWPCFR